MLLRITGTKFVCTLEKEHLGISIMYINMILFMYSFIIFSVDLGTNTKSEEQGWKYFMFSHW